MLRILQCWILCRSLQWNIIHGSSLELLNIFIDLFMNDVANKPCQHCHHFRAVCWEYILLTLTVTAICWRDQIIDWCDKTRTLSDSQHNFVRLVSCMIHCDTSFIPMHIYFSIKDIRFLHVSKKLDFSFILKKNKT